MTIAFVSAGALDRTTATTTHAPAMPASIVAGNLLFVVARTGDGSSITLPGGWTEISNLLNGARAVIGYKVAAGGDSSPTITSGSSTTIAAQVIQYGGTSSIGTFSSNAGSGTTHTCPAFTSTVDNAASVYFDFAAGGANLDAVSGWSSDVSASHADGYSCDTGTKILGTAGASSGAISATGADYGNFTWQVELVPYIESSTGTSELTLPVITAAGTASNGDTESSATLPVITAVGTAITNRLGNSSLALPMIAASGAAVRADNITASSSTAVSGSASATWVMSVGADGAIVASSSGTAILMMYQTVSEVITAASSGSAPYLFFVEAGSDLTAASAAAGQMLFFLDGSSVIVAGSSAPVRAVYAVSAESVAALMTGLEFVRDFTDGWAYNLNNGAASFYEGMRFNSFMMLDGAYYGANEDGIYRLGADSDDGAEIIAIATIGKSRLDSSAVKTVPVVYVGARSDDAMVLTCRVEGKEFSYEFSREAEFMGPARVKPGKGLEGVYWEFEITNQNGADIDIDNLEVVTAPKSRRV